MKSRIGQAISLAVALVVLGAALRYAPPADAGSRPRVTKDILFRLAFGSGDVTPQTLGTVPAGTRLYLKDFYLNGFETEAGAAEVKVLIDGADSYTVQLGSTGSINRPFSLSTGFPVNAGSEITILRTTRYTSVPIDLIIGATSVANP